MQQTKETAIMRFIFLMILLLGIGLSACVSSEPRLTSELPTLHVVTPVETAEPIKTPTLNVFDVTQTPSQVPTPSTSSPWAISLLSITTDEKPIFGSDVQLSGDGHYAVYLAENQIYLRDIQTNSSKLVSASSDGAPADDWSFSPSISSDGKTIAFFSFASNLSENPFNECPPEIGNVCGSLYIYDVPSENITRLEVAVAQSSPLDVALSADGQWVAFATPWAFYREGVYLYNRAEENLITIAAGDISNPSIVTHIGGAVVDLSADGRFVAFASPDDGLVPDDTNGVSDVFIFDRNTSQIERISTSMTDSEGNQPSGFQWVPNTGGATESGLSISEDGRYVVFMSSSDLLAQTLFPCSHWPGIDAFPSCRHIYLYDREDGKVELISVSNEGIPGNQASQDGDISADGRWVIFTSLSDNLTENGRIQCQDFSFEGYCPQIFVRDRQTQTTHLVSVGWDHQPADAYSYHPVISADGNFVTFVSGAGNLSPGILFNHSQYAWVANLSELLNAITK